MGIAEKLAGAFRSRAALALLAFVALNAAFQEACALTHFNRFEASNHRFTWWAVKGYKELAQAPDCVLLGSSLLQKVVNEGEATYLNRIINCLAHNKCVHLEENIQKLAGVRLSTYAFAIGGMHASDATAIAEGLFRDKTPKAIVYAIAPRDFMDNIMLNPADTEMFALMSRISDLGELNLHARINKNECINYSITSALAKAFPLFDYKSDLTTSLCRGTRAAIFPVLRRAGEQHSLTADAVGIKTTPFDFSGFNAIAPEHRSAIQLSDNFNCYQCCYQPFRPRHYNTQIYFLRHLLQFAKDQQIRVILVNMPLRQDNLQAMPPHFYDLYRNDVSKLASEYGAQFVDMFDSKQFKFDDFTDTVHLSGFGAIKLVDKLTGKIAPDLALAVARKDQSRQVAQTGFTQ